MRVRQLKVNDLIYSCWTILNRQGELKRSLFYIFYASMSSNYWSISFINQSPAPDIQKHDAIILITTTDWIQMILITTQPS